ncbi:MAG TPA: glycosyltransferase family 39 protein [Chryseosolibacter sp.]
MFFNRKADISIVYILIFLMIVGTFFRLYNLTYASLWFDEIHSMNGADPSSTLSDVYEYSKRDQPPLFFVILHYWLKVFGYEDFAGRALTAFIGVLGIPAMYFLGKVYKNEKVGLFGAFMVTINWFHVDVSRDIRFYALVFLLTALSYMFFLLSVRKSNTSSFFWYTFFTSLLLNTHYFGLVVYLTQFVLFVIMMVWFRADRSFIVKGLCSGLLTGLSIAHWFPVIFSDLQIKSFHIQKIPQHFFIDYAWSYFKDPASFILFAICAFLSAGYFYNRLKQRSIGIEHVIVFGWIFLSFFIPLLFSWIRYPMLMERYSIIALPAIFLVITHGFYLIPNEKDRSYLVALVLVGACLSLFVLNRIYKNILREDWRETADFFAADTAKTVVFTPLTWYHRYYFMKNHLPLPMDHKQVDISGIIKNKDHVWLLTHDYYIGPYNNPLFSTQQQQLIDQEFNLVDTVNFRQTHAYHYRRK